MRQWTQSCKQSTSQPVVPQEDEVANFVGRSVSDGVIACRPGRRNEGDSLCPDSQDVPSGLQMHTEWAKVTLQQGFHARVSLDRRLKHVKPLVVMHEVGTHWCHVTTVGHPGKQEE